MELHAYTKTISDLFSVKKKYIVPRFQRPYSWDKDKIAELWDDIILNISVSEDGTFNHEEYFIGSLVLVGDDKSISLQIVDGQQRLTTLTILLSALCQRFVEIDKNSIAYSIYENYIAGKDDDGNSFFKLVNETPKPFFQNSIQYITKQKEQPSSDEEKTLINAYNQFYDLTSHKSLSICLQNGLESQFVYEDVLKVIRDQVVKYLKVIFITVGEEDEAYTIFETLNARGMDLSFVDLIKNKVFKSLQMKHPDDKAKTQWKSLRNIIAERDGVGSLETFVRHWWISKYNYTSADNLYKHFKKKWNSKEIDPVGFLSELVNDAKTYKIFSAPLQEDFTQLEEKPIYESLVALRTFKLSQHKPFLLSLFKTRENKLIKLSEMQKILAFMEQFHFTFNAICSMRPSGIDGSYSKSARQLLECQNKQEVKTIIEELRLQLKTRVPSKDDFKDSFSELRYSKGFTKQKRLIQYIFKKLENRTKTGGELTIDSFTIEHIAPQSSSSDKYISSIGNLIPLGLDLNQEAGDKKISEKIQIYKRSAFTMTKDFVLTYESSQVWNESSIKLRTKSLAEECYEIMWSET